MTSETRSEAAYVHSIYSWSKEHKENWKRYFYAWYPRVRLVDDREMIEDIVRGLGSDHVNSTVVLTDKEEGEGIYRATIRPADVDRIWTHYVYFTLKRG